MKSLIFPWYDWKRRSLNDFSRHIESEQGPNWDTKLAILRNRSIKKIDNFDQLTKLIFPWLTERSLVEALSHHKFATWQECFHYERNRCLRDEWFIRKVVPLSHLEEDFILELELLEILLANKKFSDLFRIWSYSININRWIEKATMKLPPLESKYLRLISDTEISPFLSVLLKIATGLVVF
jgi:hypothetical protein